MIRGPWFVVRGSWSVVRARARAPYIAKGFCGARADGEAEAKPLVRAQGAHCGTACARADGDPVACHWRGVVVGWDAEGRAGGDPRAAATRKMRVVPMKRQECRFPEGRAASPRGVPLPRGEGRAAARPPARVAAVGECGILLATCT